MRKVFILLSVIMLCTCISCESQSQEEYFGKWVLGEPMIFPDTITAVNATEYEGLQIEYREDGIFIDQKLISITKKKQEKWSSIDLKNETKSSSSSGVTFDDLGIKNDYILVYIFKTNESISLPGFFIFVIDDSNMVTFIGNVYYKMKRLRTDLNEVLEDYGLVKKAKDCHCEDVKIQSYGSLEEKWLMEKDPNYEQCWLLRLENVNGIEDIFYFPRECDTSNKKEGKLEINNQIFVCDKSIVSIPYIMLKTIIFNGKTYLFLFSERGKYFDKECFIFDITDPEKITFYPPGKKFVEADILENFFGVYQNKLCLLFSKRRFDWNGQYRMGLYYIDGDSLKELSDDKGKSYYIDYTYTTRFEDVFTVDEKYVPFPA